MSDKKDKKKEKAADAGSAKAEKKDTKKKDEDSDMEPISVQGKAVKLAPGGQIYFQVLEVRDATKNNKPEEWIITLHVDDKKLMETKPTDGKDNKFHESAMYYPIPEDAAQVKITLSEKTLLSHNFKGEVRIPADELYDGYPNDKWYDLKNKEGKDKEGKESKIKGQLHMRILYLSKEEKQTHEEFKHPLQYLIKKNRLDIFQRKINDLEKQVSDKDEKGITPLLLAASEGKVGFVKVLLDNGAKPADEKDGDGRTALHLSASKGHTDVVNLLGRAGGVDVNAADTTDLKSTALHLAAEGNHGETCTMLVKRHAKIDAKNAKGDTPLTFALAVQAGAAASVTALVKAGADIYAKNNDKLNACEISQRKDICYSTTTRNAFMKATDTSDAREFELHEKFKNKQRFQGKNLTNDWKTASQYTFTVKENTKVVILVYPVNRMEDYEKKVAGCIVQHEYPAFQVVSFQQQGMGFAAAKPFEFNMEPEFAYTVCPYSMDEALNGDFGICVFTNSKAGVDGVEPKKFKHHAEIDGKWKGDNAAGSAKPLENPSFLLNVEGEGNQDLVIMLTQKSKDVSGSLFGDGTRITPAKFHVGFFIFDKTVNKELDKTPHWLNSFDVVKVFKAEGGKMYTIVPTTQKEGEELEFSLHVYSHGKVSLKSKKGEK